MYYKILVMGRIVHENQVFGYPKNRLNTDFNDGSHHFSSFFDIFEEKSVPKAKFGRK